MRRLVCNAVILTVVFTLATGITVSVGRQLPPSHAVSALHLTDCALPCWWGIVPRKTTMEEAHNIVTLEFDSSADYLVTNSDLRESFFSFILKDRLARHDYGAVAVGCFFLNNVVYSCDFQFGRIEREPRLSVADLIALLGSPDYVWVMPLGPYVFLDF